ncbi:MAG: tetratricopeptide repeat protein [Planctomycetota bacterium]
MARKKLNKKTAIIGSLALAILMVIAILILLRLGQDPEKFISDAQAAFAAKDYKEAEENYKKAYGHADDLEKQIEIAFMLADFYVDINDWEHAPGVWNKITVLDPKNIKARKSLLSYIYEAADSGQWTVWKNVETNATELIALESEPDPYLYLHRGRAQYEMARLGQSANRDQSISEAIEDLEKFKKLEPKNIEAYWYLAQSTLTKGDLLYSKGALEEREKATQQAIEILKTAVEAVPEEPKAHANLFRMKQAVAEDKEKVESLQPQIVSLTEEFPKSADVFSAAREYYQRKLLYKFDPAVLDKAIEAALTAIKLEPEDVAHAIYAARLYYQRALIMNRPEDYDKAVEVATKALQLPGAQDVPGPRQGESRSFRVILNTFLADCYIDRALDGPEEDKEKWIAEAETVVHEIEQLIGSAEHMSVVKWQGLLDLAKGKRTSGIRKMYKAFEQFKAAQIKDVQLSYRLTKAFENTSQQGAVLDFLSSAWPNITQNRPDTFLDFAGLFLRLDSADQAQNFVNRYEELYSANLRSRLIRVNANIAAGQFDEAQKQLETLNQADSNTIIAGLSLHQAQIRRLNSAISNKKLAEEGVESNVAAVDERSYEVMNAEIRKHRNAQKVLIEEILRSQPDSPAVQVFSGLCRDYINDKDFARAKSLVDVVLKYLPGNTTALVYQRMLAEPDPAAIPQERYLQIAKEVLENVPDEYERAVALARFYSETEPNKAISQYQKVLDIKPSDTIAIGTLFDLALSQKEMGLAREFAEKARRLNLDECEGNIFAARIALAEKQYKDAIARIDDALKLRPVFAFAYTLRSSVNISLGNEADAIADAQKATTLDVMNGTIAKQYASLLYQRDLKLKGSLTAEQAAQTKKSLERATVLNPADLELFSFYAEYISQENPDQALAYRIRLQKAVPSIPNAILLGNLATRMAMDVAGSSRKQALIDIADSSFQWAYGQEPQNKDVLNNYAEFYRLTDQPEKARKLLTGTDDQDLLWKLRFRSGEFAESKAILDELYTKDSKNDDVLKGLLLVAQRMINREDIKRYSQELLKVENTVETQLYQIQAYLEAGIVTDAQKKLESFRQRYPDNTQVLLLEAWLALRMGKLEDALVLVNKNLEGNQDNAAAWRLRGTANYSMGKYTEAISDLQKSKSLDDDPRVGLELARAYVRVGREDDAITELKLAVDNRQAGIQAPLMLEQAYQQFGRTRELERFYDQMIEKFPDNTLWYQKKGAFLITSKRYASAEQMYLKALGNSEKTGTASAEALDGYLIALVKEQKYNQVVETSQKYLDNPVLAMVAYVAVAEAKSLTGNKTVAVDYYRKSLEKAGDNDSAIVHIVRRMNEVMGPEQAAGLCEEKLAEKPNSLGMNTAMFNVMAMNEQYNKALKHVNKCLELVEPNSPERLGYISQKAAILLGAYRKTSDAKYIDMAMEEYESALSQWPNNPSVLNNLAYWMVYTDKDAQKAMSYAQRAMELTPDNPNIMDTYGFALYKNGKYQQADQILQAAIQLIEQENVTAPSEMYQHIGMVNEKLEQYQKAINAYEQALKIKESGLTEKERQKIEQSLAQLKEKVQ